MTLATKMTRDMLALDCAAAKAARNTPAARAARQRRLNETLDRVNLILAATVAFACVGATLWFAVMLMLTISGLG